MKQTKQNWEEEFEEEFYAWNIEDKKGKYPLWMKQRDKHIKSFILTLLEENRQEAELDNTREEWIDNKIKQALQAQKEKLLKMMKEKKLNWDTPNREIQDKDYKLGEKIGYNIAIEEMRGKIKSL